MAMEMELKYSRADRIYRPPVGIHIYIYTCLFHLWKSRRFYVSFCNLLDASLFCILLLCSSQDVIDGFLILKNFSSIAHQGIKITAVGTISLQVIFFLHFSTNNL